MIIAKKVLLVDDDDDFRGSLAEQLRLHDGFETAEVGTGSEALAILKEASFDIVLLDVGLPDFDGRELCRIVRRSGIKIPVIILTGADTDADTILGLESGANDYVVKPFKFGVLLARIRAHLRQHELSEDAIFAIGPYTFKPSAKLLVRKEGGQKVRLTEKEVAILKYLYRIGERVVGRDQLLHEVWGYQAGVTTHTLETHVYRLRQKIEEDSSNPKILLTKRGGYLLDVSGGRS